MTTSGCLNSAKLTMFSRSRRRQRINSQQHTAPVLSHNFTPTKTRVNREISYKLNLCWVIQIQHTIFYSSSGILDESALVRRFTSSITNEECTGSDPGLAKRPLMLSRRRLQSKDGKAIDQLSICFRNVTQRETETHGMKRSM